MDFLAFRHNCNQPNQTVGLYLDYYSHKGKNSMTTHLALVFIVLLTLGGCATNPVTGKNELALVSRQSEIAIGTEQYLPAQQSQGGLYQVDAELTAYVQQVGDRLAAVSDTELPYELSS